MEDVRTTNGNYPGPLVGADAAEDFEPVDLGQVQVEQDERRVALAAVVVPEKHGEGLGAVAGDDDGVEDVVFLERPDGEVPVVSVVLDEHDVPVVHGMSFALRVK